MDHRIDCLISAPHTGGVSLAPLVRALAVYVLFGVFLALLGFSIALQITPTPGVFSPYLQLPEPALFPGPSLD